MRALSLLIVLLSLLSCKQASNNSLIVGTIAGPETDLIQTTKEVAKKKYDLDIQIVTFNDYNLPNEALQDGSLDANVYQHLPYLKTAIKAHGYNLQAIGRSFVYPMGIYSKKIKSLAQLPTEALIAIPNDPSNEMRALLLLEKAGLITLKRTQHATLEDIESNPQKIRFKEMDAAQLARALPDVDAAVINTTFALGSGLSLEQDAIFTEGKDSPYANVIVIRRDTLKRPQLKLFIKALNSEEVKQKAQNLFGQAAIPAW